MAKVLTARAIEAAQPDPKSRIEIPDGGLPGLRLIVQKSGRKSWAVRFRFNGKPQKMTLGAYPAIGLVDARNLARTALRQVAEGVDPGALKKQARRAQSDLSRDFATVSHRFVTEHCKPRNRSWPETERILKARVRPAWKDRKIDDIRRADVVRLVGGIAGPAASKNTLAVIRKLFNWCVDVGLLESSPAIGLKPRTQIPARDRVLSNSELTAVWRASEALDYRFRSLVRLLVLTAQRRNEVAGMQWREIENLDGDSATWVIPPSRAKNSKVNAVPLSSQCVEILRELHSKADPEILRRGGLILTWTGQTQISGFSKMKRQLDVATKVELQIAGQDADIAPWRIHDLRRTAATGLASLRVPLAVTEKILNHVSGAFAGVAGIYQRWDFIPEKREALQKWADHIDTLLAAPAIASGPTEGAGNIVRFPSRQRGQ